MTISKTTVELSAVAALLAVMLGGFYYQGNRLDEFMRRQDARVDGLEQRIDDLERRLDARIDGLAERLARIEGILERWLATTPPRPPQQPS